VPTQRDYYSILQVNPSASQEAIEAAYQRLSKIYDPQVSKKRKAAERRLEIEEAYEVLSDRKRRAEYDRLRARGWRPGQPLKEERPATGIFAWMGNPYAFASMVASGVVIILVAIVVISVLDTGGTAAPNPTPSAAALATPTTPAQTPGVAPESPPEVTGETVTEPSGLQYIDIVTGAGDGFGLGDTVVVNYTGWLADGGTKFDSSVDKPQPFRFTVGLGKVIRGWEKGMEGMKVGGKRRIILPPDLAYGEAGNPPVIPPNATLIFDIELLDVFKAGETAAPAASPAPSATPAASDTASPAPSP